MNSLHHSTIDFCQRGKQWGMCTTLGAHVVLGALLLVGWPSVATQVLPPPAMAQGQAVLSLRVTPAPKKTPIAPPKAAPQTLPNMRPNMRPDAPAQPLSPLAPDRPKEQLRPTKPATVNPAPAKSSQQTSATKAPDKKAAAQAMASTSPAASATAATAATTATQADPTQMAQARQTVLSYFMALLEQYKHYPRAARKLGLEGRITVELRLDAQGNITHLAIGAADAHPVLQKALGESLHKIRSHWQTQHLVKGGGQALSLTVPVRFSLQE